MARGAKIPDGLTVKVTTNVREKTTRILAYRKGGFKRAYKAVIPMCSDEKCRRLGPHKRAYGRHQDYDVRLTHYHPRDVDILIKNLVKSYC